MSDIEKQPGPARSNVALRAASAAVLIPVALACVWLGGWYFAALATIAGCLMAWEWSRMMFAPRSTVLMTAVLSGGVVTMFMAAGIGLLPIYLIAFVAFWSAALLLTTMRESGRTRWALLGMPYVSFPVFALIVMRIDPAYGMLSVIWLLAVIWATDTAAFFAGRSIGGPKLAPSVSPNKTWSGAIAGTVAASAAGVTVAVVTGLPGPVLLGLFSAFISVVGQAGDLLESALKRRAGVKDSSNLIPGHGGVMDRLDSLVTASVVSVIAGFVHAGYPHAARGILVWQW